MIFFVVAISAFHGDIHGKIHGKMIHSVTTRGVSSSMVDKIDFESQNTRVPGDVDFDPLQLSQSYPFANLGLSALAMSKDEALYQYREAEVKHGRVAMLAALCYPFNDVLDLNHAKWKVAASIILFCSVAESYKLFVISKQQRQNSVRLPADYNIRVTDEKDGSNGFFKLQTGEVWNGRVAMLAFLSNFF